MNVISLLDEYHHAIRVVDQDNIVPSRISGVCRPGALPVRSPGDLVYNWPVSWFGDCLSRMSRRFNPAVLGYPYFGKGFLGRSAKG